ncbi:MAG: RdgB/HAM1 family non-canonical purine NTP pyrophosphatase [Rubrivivax sp.]|nr:RdgB/HAM1 family non-canonical purine NTP pyrophosphatase [Rubrivivax sp.]MDP3225516.1 RdgB/HAM1 family non-canonical purine NTP pyrophosphatase [Rubrivivax sp.]MDP3610378.1 RdgB/HAM1 family non-canonical purine NTP pyrophosphatase [Rubrivivax sp.]
MRLVLASNNAKKLSEMRSLLSGLAVQLVPQGELGIAEAEEPHITFIENALAKARHAAAASQGAAIADDSGVCVDVLGGEPGVVSAHFAGELPALPGGDREQQRKWQDAANNTLLLQRLQGSQDRSAHFLSTLVAVRHAHDPEPLVAMGRWPGRILETPQGDLGFGYDPLMFIPDLGCTVAQMDTTQKNRHSHRARAMAQMLVLLKDVWKL